MTKACIRIENILGSALAASVIGVGLVEFVAENGNLDAVQIVVELLANGTIASWGCHVI